MDSIQEGSYLLLFHTPRKKWLIKVVKGKKMHTHLGIIDIDAIIGLPYGTCVKTTEDRDIYLLKPTIYDFVMKSERKYNHSLSSSVSPRNPGGPGWRMTMP